MPARSHSLNRTTPKAYDTRQDSYENVPSRAQFNQFSAEARLARNGVPSSLLDAPQYSTTPQGRYNPYGGENTYQSPAGGRGNSVDHEMHIKAGYHINSPPVGLPPRAPGSDNKTSVKVAN
jgi:hypothetical protein